MHEKILVVEDEASIADFLQVNLSKEGFSVVWARDGLEAVELFGQHSPDLVLLDMMLPGLTGLDVLKRIRHHSEAPVLVVSVRDDEVDKVCALEMGADDYVTKPFSARELVARIRANLRVGRGQQRVRLADLEIDFRRAELFRDGVRIFLSAREFETLHLLYQNRDRVLTRDFFLERVWGYDYEGDPRVVDTTVKRLRRKIGADLVETVRGLGYRLPR
ncbi:MAG: response regulator transcription factor [Vulcanimicrobiota bacterium]